MLTLIELRQFPQNDAETERIAANHVEVNVKSVSIVRQACQCHHQHLRLVHDVPLIGVGSGRIRAFA